MDKEVQRIERYSDILDTKFRIPFTNIRFGLDFIIGLFPVVGDIFSLTLSGGLIIMMIKKGASGKALAMMILNVVLDTTIGAIPFFGDIFDLFFKSNKRNLDLFQAHFEEGRYQGSAKSVVFGVVVIFIMLFALVIYLTYQLIAALLHFIVT